MRLHTLLALMTVGVGYAALTACDGGEKPSEEADTDTDTDADTDSDTDVDFTGDTGPTGPFVWIGFAGGGNYDIAGDTYSGEETFGVYEFNDYANPDLGDATALCEFAWPASNPTPVPAPCADCDWAANVTMGTGAESGPAGGCAGFGIDSTVNDGLSFGYGYNPAYEYQGQTFPVLMYYSQTNSAWGAGTDLGVSYDDTTGDFTYIFLSDYGYL